MVRRRLIPESYPGSGSTWYDISGNDKDYTITFDTGGGFSATYGGLIDFGSGLRPVAGLFMLVRAILFLMLRPVQQPCRFG